MKQFLKTIKEVWNDSRGRAFLFFGFYFFFFFILILMIRGGHHQSTDNQNYETGKKYSISFQELLDKNYSYSYSEVLDGNTFTYDGKKNGEEELFQLLDSRYYFDGKDYYIKEEQWKKSENPFLLSDLFDVEKIVSLIESSTYESVTNYESGREVYHFLISSNTINQVIYGINSDYMEEPNKIVVSVNEKKQVDGISFYLNSYCTLHQLCSKSFDIKISYSDYGKIEKIESPIS